MRNMIIASTSTVHSSGYLEYLMQDILQELAAVKATSLLFIPFARPGGLTHDAYTKKVGDAFAPHGITVNGIHTFENMVEAINTATAIFTGGGNTFVLVKTLHDYDLMQPLRKAIYNGAFYLGTSAGSNICGLNMRTTNDMPVVMPASFKTTGAVGYNINPHYLDPEPGSTHMGETREERINEFHFYNNIPVVGLREGSYIKVKDDVELLCGSLTARIFTKDNPAIEVPPGHNLSTLT